MASEIEIAWAAGLFEGEGCATMSSHGGRTPHLLLCSTDEDVVLRFRRIVGEGNVYRRERPHGRKTTYQWSTAKKAGIERILFSFMPYLGKRRAFRAKELLAICSQGTRRKK